MVNVTPNDVRQMVQVVPRLHDEVAQVLKSFGLEPSTNSKAAQELQSYPRHDSILTAYSQGLSLIEVAADQAMAFTKTATEPAQTVAPWTCVRALLEASALACWLLAPAIDVRTRIGRSFAFRYEGLSQQVKFARAVGGATDLAKSLARIDEVEKVALDLGFSRVENHKKERIGIGQQMPNATELIRDVLNEEANYRLFSAAAHAHHWALQRMSFRIADEGNYTPGRSAGQADGHLLEKNIEPISLGYLCMLTAKYCVKPIRFKCLLFGWDMKPLEDVLDAAFTDLRIRRDAPLWHSH